MTLPPTPAGEETPPPVNTPIDRSSSDVAVAIRQFATQLVIALGAIISFMGLAESSWIVKLYRFLTADEFKPVLGVLVLLAASGYQLWKTVKRHREGQVLALLPTTPDSVAKGPETPSAAVEKAVEVATAKIVAESTPAPYQRPTRGL